jgi:hypothetical protein
MSIKDALRDLEQTDMSVKDAHSDLDQDCMILCSTGFFCINY